MTIQSKPKGSILLKIVILVLVGVLIYSLWEPYKVKRHEELLMQETRLRMSNLRNAQMFYYKQYQTYVSDLDSLIHWIETDSLVVEKRDSLFRPLAMGPFIPESLKYSPRSPQQYKILVDDTSATKRYLIEDPDSRDFVGSLEDLTLLHRGSWEY